jgi:hypothetical protein
MNLIARVRTMNKALRVMLISLALLMLCQIGQFMSISDINRAGHEGDLAIFFLFAAIFIVPTSLILTSAILWGARGTWRQQRPIMLLGAINILIALNITWFFVHQCSWSQAVGIALRSCAR